MITGNKRMTMPRAASRLICDQRVLPQLKALTWVVFSLAPPEPRRLIARLMLVTALFAASLPPAVSSAKKTVVGDAVTATFDERGRLWRLTPRKHHLELDYSDDFGSSFSEPVRVNPKRQRIRALPEDRPDIVVGNGRIHVLYSADAAQPWTSFYSVSTDGGISFDKPIRISDQAERARHHQGRLFIDSNGQAQALWIDEREFGDTTVIGGALFVGTRNESNGFDNRLVARGLCECCRLAIDAEPGGRPVVLARWIFPGQVRDHAMVTPNSAGAASAPVRATVDDWSINACVEHGPALAIADNGDRHISWFTYGRQRNGLFYARSRNAGRSFSPPLRFGDLETIVGHADILAIGEHVALVWKERRDRTTAIRFSRSSDGGDNWSEPKTLALSELASDHPFLLSHGARLFLSWYARDTGYRLIPIP